MIDHSDSHKRRFRRQIPITHWALLLLIATPINGCDVPTKLKGPKKFKEAARIEYDGGTENAKLVRLKFVMLDQAMLKDLRSNQTLEVVEINECQRQPIPILDEVARLPLLRELTLNHVTIADEELVELADCKNLEFIELSLVGFTGDGLKHIAHLPIERLIVRGHTLTAEGVKHILNMQELRELELFVPSLNSVDIPILANLPKLRMLKLLRLQCNYRVDGGLKCLAGLDHLEDFELSGGHISKRVFDCVGRLANLKRLRISNSNVNDEGLLAITSLKKLEWLRLDGCQALSEDALLTIAQLSNLRDITLDGTVIRGSKLTAIAEMPELKRIEIRGKDLDESAITAFQSMNKDSRILLMQGDALEYMRQTGARIQNGGPPLQSIESP
jgi:hypothetical protein